MAWWQQAQGGWSQAECGQASVAGGQLGSGGVIQKPFPLPFLPTVSALQSWWDHRPQIQVSAIGIEQVEGWHKVKILLRNSLLCR